MKCNAPDTTVAVRVSQLTKSFRIPVEPTDRLKHKITNLFRGGKGYRNFTPLKGVSFDIKRGDFFGIVGCNGSGKSTLLKTIAGIYTPNAGKVEVHGSLVPFIELGVGFNPELSGRENVYLNGALLGFSQKEMDAMYTDIVEFAGLTDFMDEKLKNYSSGMQVRLAFSVAIKVKGDILLLDEVLAVGDAAFQQKCFEYFEEVKRSGQTVIFVTHDMGAVRRFCSRAMYLENGQVKMIGDPQDIADAYTEVNLRAAAEAAQQKKEADKKDPVTIKLILPRKRIFSQRDTITIGMTAQGISDEIFANYSLAANGFVFADRNSKDQAKTFIQNNKRVDFIQPLNGLNPGTYDVYISLHRTKDNSTVKHLPRAYSFIVKGVDPLRDGPMRSEGSWRSAV